MKEYHVLNLGAGVQSTTLALLAAENKLLGPDGNPVKLDCAIFADTQDEPRDPGHNVYEHLDWLEKQVPFPVWRRSVGKLGELVSGGINSTGQKFVSIPAFTTDTTKNNKVGRLRRQCTKEHKISVVERSIRRDLLSLNPGQRIPKETVVRQYVGISLDEIGRMLKAKARHAAKPKKWTTFHYPLCEALLWTRADCRKYLADKVPHRVPRSACTFCPYHSNEEWLAMKIRGGDDWTEAVSVDNALRAGSVLNRNNDQLMYLHRSCRPLDEIDFETDRNGDKEMAGECEGMCGN